MILLSPGNREEALIVNVYVVALKRAVGSFIRSLNLSAFTTNAAS
jgi:hypothetical protein